MFILRGKTEKQLTWFWNMKVKSKLVDSKLTSDWSSCVRESPETKLSVFKFTHDIFHWISLITFLLFLNSNWFQWRYLPLKFKIIEIATVVMVWIFFQSATKLKYLKGLKVSGFTLVSSNEGEIGFIHC